MYGPLRGVNEGQSAEPFKKFSAEANLPGAISEVVSAYIIRNAKYHPLSVETVGNPAPFLDIGLPVLGRSTPGYFRYTEQTRLEYQHVHPNIFLQKRAEVLKAFLQIKRFFV